MPYVRDSLLARARVGSTSADMQRGALRLVHRGRRSCAHHRSLDGASPLSVFARRRGAGADRPAAGRLRAGDLEPPEGRARLLRQGGQGPLHGAVALHRPARRRPARRTAPSRCTSTAQVVKTWARIERGSQTDWADFPPEKVAFFMRTPQWCLKPGRRARAARDRARSRACSSSNALHPGCARPRGWSASPTSTGPSASMRRAAGPSRSATPSTAPSRASWSPAPRTTAQSKRLGPTRRRTSTARSACSSSTSTEEARRA